MGDTQYKVESRLPTSKKFATSAMNAALKTTSAVTTLEVEAIVVRGFFAGFAKMGVDNSARG